jgi:hypothetical protein
MSEIAVQETEVKTHDDVINEEIEQEHAEAEELQKETATSAS